MAPAIIGATSIQGGRARVSAPRSRASKPGPFCVAAWQRIDHARVRCVNPRARAALRTFHAELCTPLPNRLQAIGPARPPPPWVRRTPFFAGGLVVLALALSAWGWRDPSADV